MKLGVNSIIFTAFSFFLLVFLVFVLAEKVGFITLGQTSFSQPTKLENEFVDDAPVVLPPEVVNPSTGTVNTEPSERALKVAALYFIYAPQDDVRAERLERFSEGTGNVSIAVKNLAIDLDEEPEKLILFETVLEEYLRN